jgi:hypothetical protein
VPRAPGGGDHETIAELRRDSLKLLAFAYCWVEAKARDPE